MTVLLDYVRENHAALLLVTHDEGMASKCDVVYKLDDKVLNKEEN